MGLLVTAGLTLRLATFSTLLSAHFSSFFFLLACALALLFGTLYHQNGKSGTTHWLNADEILPDNGDFRRVQVFLALQLLCQRAPVRAVQ